MEQGLNGRPGGLSSASPTAPAVAAVPVSIPDAWRMAINGWDRSAITDDILAEHGEDIVHVLCGPTKSIGNWMYANGNERHDVHFSIGSSVSGGKFATGRWTLADAHQRTRDFDRSNPRRECIFERAEPITLLSCPLCGHHAVFGDPVHGERWGTWRREVYCSSSHCRCSVALPSDRDCVEERLAAKWNRRVRASQGIEAGTATTGTGVVHESPVAESDAPTPTLVNQGEAEILRERAQIVAWLREDADLTEAESRKIISNSHGLKPRDIEDWRNLVATKRGIADAIERGEHLTAFLQPLASPQ